ncbi:hypothetical protein MTR67_013122 [Solanum verrucosum]|uniref:Tf2-1-like SH3-like domain-containing protein n=1 Tax=Solanum verrucosum TaxID=315347 RepID=A0AAF0QA03_SOLVR|nr:hypothetical protein MTR67_013122 [Solanum verrucosum]
MKGVMRFGKKGKPSPRYIGPYRIAKRIGNVAYELELPQELATVYPVFHISMLKKCLGNPSLILPTESVRINDSLSYEEIPVQILYRQVRRLRTKDIASVKVLWRNQFVEEAKEDMKKRYPYLFESGGNVDQGPDFEKSFQDFKFETIPEGLPPSDRDVTQDPASLCDSIRKNCLTHFWDLLSKLISSPVISPISCIISDGMMSFAIKAEQEFGILDVQFWTASACGYMGYLQYDELRRREIIPFKADSTLDQDVSTSLCKKNIGCQGSGRSYVGEVLSGSKLVERGNVTFVRMLVQWTKLPIEDSTLEDYKC